MLKTPDPLRGQNTYEPDEILGRQRQFGRDTLPLNNLPYGVFSTAEVDGHCGVAIGDMILDVTALEEEG